MSTLVASGVVASLGITAAIAVITATGTVAVGSYTLTPTYTNGRITWVGGGTCAAAGVC
jgi:type IV pilus assembly protein PilA